MVDRPRVHATRLALERRRRREEALLRYVMWLPPQLAFRRDASKRKLLRAGNQGLGKTYAGAAEAIAHLLGDHPFYDVPKPPTKGWAVAATWKQSLAIQNRVWELVPKAELTQATRAKYTEARGWGDDPVVEFQNGSLLYIRTTKQGGLSLAGPKLHFVWCDEPPISERIYTELCKRTTKTNGWVWVTMTPINAPVEWIKRKAEEGKISDHHYRMVPENLVQEGCTLPIRLEDGTLCDQDWIDSLILDTPSYEVPVVVHGEWNCRSEVPVFEAFHTSGPTTNVASSMPSGQADLYLGIDHGLRVHAQVAVLMALQWPDGPTNYPRAWVLDEAVGGGMTSDDDDAEAILAMLERHGMRWSDLHRVYGDRPHHGSYRRGSIAKKSNARLSAALERHDRAKHHGIRRGVLDPPVSPAKRGAVAQPGAVQFGCTELHRLMVRPDRFWVHRRCEHVIDALQKYDLTPNSDESHFVDCIRYGLKDYLYRGGNVHRARQRVVFR